MPTDPLTYALGQENLWLRELLEQVARDLEGISAREEYAVHTMALQGRAMRIRKRLHEGLPAHRLPVSGGSGIV
jgi:hypothetical protein